MDTTRKNSSSSATSDLSGIKETRRRRLRPVPQSESSSHRALPRQSLSSFVAAANENGAGAANVRYQMSVWNSEYAYIYLMKKYKSKCYISGCLVFIPKETEEVEGKLKYLVENDLFQKAHKIGKDLLKCIHAGVEVIFIPLRIFYRKNDDAVGHRNMLIYRPALNVIERFEPMADDSKRSNYDAEIDRCCAELFEIKLRPTLQELRYVPAFQLCPIGLQTIEEELERDEEEGNYCQMWSIFIMESVLLNPEMETKDIIKKCLSLANREPAYLRSVIRGYVLNISKEIKEAYHYSIETGVVERDPIDDMLDDSEQTRYNNLKIDNIYQAALNLAMHYANA